MTGVKTIAAVTFVLLLISGCASPGVPSEQATPADPAPWAPVEATLERTANHVSTCIVANNRMGGGTNAVLDVDVPENATGAVVELTWTAGNPTEEDLHFELRSRAVARVDARTHGTSPLRWEIDGESIETRWGGHELQLVDPYCGNSGKTLGVSVQQDLVVTVLLTFSAD